MRRDLGVAGAASREDVAHDREAAHVEQEIVDLAVEQRGCLGVEDCGCHAASFVELELGGAACARRAVAAEASQRDDGTREQHPVRT